MKKAEDSCPFLVPVVADRLWVVRTPAYCRAADHVRVPAPRTVASRCLGGYRACSGYRAAVARARREDGTRS